MTDTPLPARPLRVTWFDGQSARGMPAQLRLHGDMLDVMGSAGGKAVLLASLPVREVRWPERTRAGSRVAFLPDGASVHALHEADWDDWMALTVHQLRPESLVVQAQQSWRRVLLAGVLLAGVIWILYMWGLPLAARGVVAVLPHQVDALIGESALNTIDRQILQPSQLPRERQQRLEQRMLQAAQAQYGGKPPPFRLVFRSAPQIGPNAFALPGGSMVLLDELVELAGDDDDMVLGVLGHELGHVAHRHGMRQLVQTTALGAIASAAFGDYASLLTTAPVILLNMGYSRGAEHEADVHAVQFMRAAHISPDVMARFFEKVQTMPRGTKSSGSGGNGTARPASDASAPGDASGSTARKHKDDEGGLLGIAFSSHPATADRIAFFRKAAGG